MEPPLRHGIACGMGLFILTAFTMVAFASNSILTRMAIEPGYIDPFSFALIRVVAGSAFLLALVLFKGGRLPLTGRGRLVGAVSLAVYMIGFSLAYISLDAGIGALILFGVVQITMFSYSAIIGARPARRQIIGACIAFAGLLVGLWPGAQNETTLLGAISMMVAGVGWAVYTLAGKNASNPLSETAANFLICLPPLFLLTIFMFDNVTPAGVLIASLCGAVTSGLGYALWYVVLPALERGFAAIVQLSVPIIAIFVGAVVLNEPVTLDLLAAGVLVIFGIGLAVTKGSTQEGRS